MQARLRIVLGAAAVLLLLALPLLTVAQGTPSLRYDSNETGTRTGQPGDIIVYRLVLQNLGPNNDQYDLEATNDKGWPVSFSVGDPVPVNSGSSISFQVTVEIPATAANGTSARTIVTATSVGDPLRAARVTLTTLVATATPTITPTPSPTPSITPTGTIRPTRTPGPCDDRADDTKGQAQVIDVNLPVSQIICPAGDEDWYYFGGLAGKVYTIDITAMASGIDLSLSLYDSRGNLIAFNDDFSRNETPNEADDLRPRIQSWRAPVNDHYYIQVRDASLRGAGNMTYTIALQSESYGPTATLIAEICEDLYEPDGLPELATLMVFDEVHPDHRLCPSGDADWVRFFAKSGKTYTIATSGLTRGADTVLVLADRDGVSIIDFDDDSGGGLASQITFSPAVDGFYYAQVKNIGDIGNQFIGYTLSYSVGSGSAPQPTRQVSPTPRTGTSPTAGTPTAGTPTAGTPTAGTPTSGTPGTTTPTGSTTPTVTQTPATPYSFSMAEKVPVATLAGGQFVDPAFGRVWQRSDGPVGSGAVQRSWLWGPEALVARAEVYDESPGGLRQVQYFDKARMEISQPGADRGSQWYVTNGLLVKEMIEGQVQIGDGNMVRAAPAVVPIAGDINDPNAPTYASLAEHLPAVGDRSGSLVAEAINRQGAISRYSGPARPESRLVTYIPETGHNIPQVFWDFFQQRGPVAENGRVVNGTVMDWLFAMGYPISEPFWTQAQVGGRPRWVLVQAYQRRVLTYTPDNPAAWRIEMGNVGLHYYTWRYGAAPR